MGAGGTSTPSTDFWCWKAHASATPPGIQSGPCFDLGYLARSACILLTIFDVAGPALNDQLEGKDGRKGRSNYLRIGAVAHGGTGCNPYCARSQLEEI